MTNIDVLSVVDETGETLENALSKLVLPHFVFNKIEDRKPIKYFVSQYKHIVMDELTKENIAPIVCRYGSNSRMSSSEAAKMIREDMERQFQTSVSFDSYQEASLVEKVKKYRNGVSLEKISQEILDIVKIVSCGYDLNIDFSDPFLSVPISIKCDQIGDIMYKQRDSTWIECDGRWLNSLDYPELYSFLSTCIWDSSWGKRGSMATSSVSGIRFNIPTLAGAWIKVKN